MKLVINGEEMSFKGQTLKELMEDLDIYKTKAAVAVNGGFIPKDGHASLTLSEGDEIEILSPMQGG